MPANITEVAVDREIDGTTAFEHRFDPLVLHGVLFEMDPKQAGAPVCMVSGNGSETREFQSHAQSRRPGRFKAQIQGDAVYDGIRVTIARGKTARLLKIKLIGKPPSGPTAAR